jgi:phosphatidate cytidylyltransferase
VKPGFLANLAQRVVTAIVLLPLVLLAIFKGPPALGVAIVALLVLLGLGEFFRLVRARALQPLRLTGLLLCALIFLEETYPLSSGASLWPLAALLLLTATLLRAGDLATTVPAAAATLLGAIYLGALGGALAGLLLLPPVAQGPWRLTLLLGSVMLSDVFAFFVGHACGRHRLAPALSPGKTVEGALGGLVGGVLGALGVRALGLPALAPLEAALLGLGVAALGIVGDLLESLLKRWAGVKDSGTLFPGHGGALDRLDSLLFAAPLLYYFFSWQR